MFADKVHWTINDLKNLPDDDGWTRYEIINGGLFVSRLPHAFHQMAAGELLCCLAKWTQEKKSDSTVVLSPGLLLSPADSVIPDLVWIKNERLEAGLNGDGHLTVAPELIAEVLSAGGVNEQRDRDSKLKLYSRYGVREYWIVDWRQKSLEIYRRDQAQLKLVATLLDSDPITSPLLPEFAVPLDQIFK
ncbi:Uma2 family endonuclease [[Limnothrix rosea] IAM M-220]|uniref:Uma2 family endonuclease n=1 Tax=[Limnothrix rosea] IAM M-220 TaxID=454133 RepID=UPI00095A039E|nr:Uma2 family endonuclease [[Limnothrix rosea] IAM M-220]OKH19449.1 hypothetical protein NIES208_02535 [[Limnothrix rosea] IAM M-220]